ncbi:unnamed protein product [Paramecium pentaurelia]|uniref:Uncharacterized protein n=1 Tax=Paramecium pentaurelia TaxID=43138 RepID=A0A8S1XI14_9CILI|nr:unnamed protein product [Paramecium pentaurelia]
MSETELKEKIQQAILKDQDPKQLLKKIMVLISEIEKNEDEIQKQIDQTKIEEIKKAQIQAQSYFYNNTETIDTSNSLYPYNQALLQSKHPGLKKLSKISKPNPHNNDFNKFNIQSFSDDILKESMKFIDGQLKISKKYNSEKLEFKALYQSEYGKIYSSDKNNSQNQELQFNMKSNSEQRYPKSDYYRQNEIKTIEQKKINENIHNQQKNQRNHQQHQNDQLQQLKGLNIYYPNDDKNPIQFGSKQVDKTIENKSNQQINQSFQQLTDQETN